MSETPSDVPGDPWGPDRSVPGPVPPSWGSAGPSYGPPPGAPYGPVGPKPENYLAWTIVTTILCCWPLGIPSIVYATRVDSAWYRGDVAGAHRASRSARRWMLANVLSLVGIVVVFGLFVVLAAVFGEPIPDQTGTTGPTY